MERPGAPDVLRLVEREASAPGQGEALVRHTVIGATRARQHRTGAIRSGVSRRLGMEACGVVEALGRTSPGSRSAIALHTRTRRPARTAGGDVCRRTGW